MEKRKLGASDLDVSVLGLGCWQFGGGNYWGAQDQSDVNLVVHRAMELGVNYFDTAEAYNNGESESSLGVALKGRRDKAVIGSKISPDHMYPVMIRERCEASLQRMQTDYIDLYMVHWPISGHAIAHYTKDPQLIAQPPDIREAFGELAKLQHENKIRHIGVSNHGIQQMKELQVLELPFVANELAYNLFSRAIEDSILPYCLSHSIGVIGYMPLQQGLLTGKYDNLDMIPSLQARSRHFHKSRGEGTRHGEEGAEMEINQALKEMKQLAKELNVHRIVLSLAWIIANQGIASTIVGSRDEKQLELNLQGAQYALKPEVIAKLNEITIPVWKRLGSNPDYYENRNNSRVY